MEKDEVSGILKIRIPKSIHLELITEAKNEGVSVNQYCVAILVKTLTIDNQLSLGYQKANVELLRIRRLADSEDTLFDMVMNFRQRIDALKPMLFQQILSVMKIRGIPENDVIDLESKFPVISGRSFNEKLPVIKIPNLKLVIFWDTNTDLAEEIIKKYIASCDDNVKTHFLPGYIDQLDKCGPVFKYTRNDTPVFSVTVWGNEFKLVKESILKLKNQLNDVWKGSKKLDDILGAYDKKRESLNDSSFDRTTLQKIKFKIEPEFIFDSIAGEYEQYKRVVETQFKME